jgi:hypothetical protein
MATKDGARISPWTRSNRADPDCLPLADRHYNRQKPGSPQFVPPGRCLVLKRADAVWVTSWPFAEFVKHAWAGAWINSMFRHEGEAVASELIRAAVAATRATWPTVPALGMVTFIDPVHVKPRMVRGRPTWGHSYFAAGFEHVGYTKAGLWAMQLRPERMPEPEAACEDAPMFTANVATVTLDAVLAERERRT